MQAEPMTDSPPPIALVTGAAQGIGEATARRLADQGVPPILVDVNPAGEAVARSIGATGRAASFVACDLTDFDQVRALGDQVADRFGTLDVLVNNAGWTP